MGLTQVQNIMARLYTDKGSRKTLLMDPRGLAREYGLDDLETEKLSRLSPTQIEDFSVSLINKRLGDVRKKMPFTARAMGRKFTVLFHHHAQQQPVSKKTKKNAEDSLQFVAFIQRRAVDEKIEPWLLELMRYEGIRIKATVSRIPVHAGLFKYDIKDFLNVLIQGTEPVSPRKKATVAIWITFPKRIWHRLI